MFIKKLFYGNRKSQTNQASTQAPGAVKDSPKIKFEYRLNSGHSYYTTVSSRMSSKMEFPDKTIKNSNKADIGLVYVIEKDSAGNTSIGITYDKVKVAVNKDGNEQLFDAALGKNSFDPVERILHNLIGATLRVSLNGQGEVLAVA